MIRTVRAVFTESGKNFLADEALQLAAAISFYSLLSMAPLLLIVVAVAGVFFADDTVRTELVAQMRDLVGEEGAAVATTVLANAGFERGNRWSVLLGALLMIVGATTVFAQLQAALNRVWQVKAEPRNAILGFLRHRLWSFALVLSIGFLLMVSLVVSALLAALHAYLDDWAGSALVWRALNVLVSFGMVTLLIAIIFKYLPDALIRWSDVWLGALITALLFVVGKWVIGMYLGQASIGSAFGAAGSVVVFMLWIYYASMIFLLGAEITQSVARQRGRGVMPSPHAQRV